MNHEELFRKTTGHAQAHAWQTGLADDSVCRSRLVRIPTGFGKTQGVLAAWLWNRVVQNDDNWPRRLVWCLPMRVLVEQTEAETRKVLEQLGILWASGDHTGKVGVHLLMGGIDSGDWHLYPDECAVLIGTQDMLLSRALNRGYGAARARWPMDFGLLNQDSLWVMDEVQLMDVGLATSGQLQSFRDEDWGKVKAGRPCCTWWMSATLQREWLGKSPETKGLAASLPQTAIPEENRHGLLWDDVHKSCEIQTVKDDAALAKLVAASHLDTALGNCGANGPTLVVVNTVDRAVKVYETIKKDNEIKNKNVELRLVHSRFRPAERSSWRTVFLNREACAPGTNRIIVATQVVEAGVDISAGLLITELAPWASLVQRFGRCARWGGEAQVIVADFQHKEKKAAPYEVEALEAARSALAQLDDVSPLRLEQFEENNPSLLPGLYPYEPRHLLLRHELDQLFDTTPDLTGADVDISRFIRSGEERDLHVFWEEVPDKVHPLANIRPCRDALCAVPFLKVRDWLCGPETQNAKAPRLKSDKRAWVWDWLDACWRKAERRDLYPGQTVLVAASCGGYHDDFGWRPEEKSRVFPVAAENVSLDEQADSGQDDESLSINQWRTIATHGREVALLVRGMAERLVPEFAPLFDLSGRVHDPGKAFDAMQGSIKRMDGRPDRNDLAKAPDEYWEKGRRLYPMPDGSRRPGFRHELAGVLALFAVLERHAPDHPALLGPWREILACVGMQPPFVQDETVDPPTSLEREIIALDADQFNLLAFLVCAHHGKIGIAWHACPADQEAVDGQPRLRGVCDGDCLPAMPLFDAAGGLSGLPGLPLNLAPASAGLNPRTGQGWTERVLGLLTKYGPFRLAWLAALLRAADQRASRDSATPDPLLQENINGNFRMERSDSGLATPAGTGKTAYPLATDSPQCGPEHGLRGGTGGSGDAGSATRPPAHATRHIETRLGLLTYAELAPHLAKNVQTIEEWIDTGEFDASDFDDTLVLTLHSLICEELTPQFVGWRRHDVLVGQHNPPPFYQVPMLIREYGRDLAVRLAASGQEASDLLLETMAFAEGRLLSIHPFADFNGRVTRVFLRLLLRRLDLPAVDLIPPPDRWQDYLDALREADRLNWQPLMRVWQQRFEQEVA